jgi:hypothetical protein
MKDIIYLSEKAAAYLQSGESKSFSGCLSLILIKLCRNCDHCFVNLSKQQSLHHIIDVTSLKNIQVSKPENVQENLMLVVTSVSEPLTQLPLVTQSHVTRWTS